MVGDISRRTFLYTIAALGLDTISPFQEAIPSNNCGTKCQESLSDLIDDSIMDFLDAKNIDQTRLTKNKSQAIITLSNIAEGLAQIAKRNPKYRPIIKTHLDKVINYSFNPRVMPIDIKQVKKEDLLTHGLFISHLNIILGEYERIAKNGKYQEINQDLSQAILVKSMLDPNKHLKSFPNVPYKWPADQAATLYSLHLYDKNFNDDTSEVPIAAWLYYMENRGTDPRTGLHISEVTGKAYYSNIPRGCALSWTVKYMADFAPREAKILWDRYKENFLKDYFVVAGFREWPRGVDKGEDTDSGPIINGIGTAATAFGLGASKVMNDLSTYKKINKLINAGYTLISLSGNNSVKKISNNLLSNSIRFSSVNQ